MGRQSQGFAHRVDERLAVAWLEQEVRRAELHRFDRSRDRSVSRQHDHREVGVARAQLLEQGDPVHSGHAHVADDDIGLLDELQRRASVLRDQRTPILLGDESGQHRGHRGVVVHDQDSFFHSEYVSSVGMRITTRVPAPSWL